jgi:hypothetical protein
MPVALPDGQVTICRRLTARVAACLSKPAKQLLVDSTSRVPIARAATHFLVSLLSWFRH